VFDYFHALSEELVGRAGGPADALSMIETVLNRRKFV